MWTSIPIQHNLPLFPRSIHGGVTTSGVTGVAPPPSETSIVQRASATTVGRCTHRAVGPDTVPQMRSGPLALGGEGGATLQQRPPCALDQTSLYLAMPVLRSEARNRHPS